MSASSSALVTGASRGLGRALADRLRADGWDVRTLTRREVDLSDLDAVPAAVKNAVAGLDRLDLVLLCAGVLGDVRDLKDQPVERLRGVLDVNVWANKQLIDALAIPVGHVVAISSGASHRAGGGLGAYGLSKAALNILLRVYSSERPETCFTAAAPGHVGTDMWNAIREGPDDPRYATVNRLKAATAVQTPEEAAARLIACLPKLRAAGSGAYVDVRDL